MSATLGLHKKKTSTGRQAKEPGELSAAGFFANSVELSLRFWKCETFARRELWHVLLGRRRTVAREHTKWYRDLLGCTERNCSPSCSPFGKGYIASPRTKDSLGTGKGPFIGRGQRSMQRIENLVSAFPGATP